MTRLIFRSTVEEYKKIGSGISPLETSAGVQRHLSTRGHFTHRNPRRMDGFTRVMTHPRRAFCPGPVCKEMRVPDVPLLWEWPESVIGKFLHIDILSLQFSEVEPRENEIYFWALSSSA